MIHFKIAGLGSYLPEKIATNADFEKIVDTSDEWITERTGIKERRIAVSDTNYQMGAKAAKLALERSGISPEEIDMVVVSTATSDYGFPSVACFIQNELGLKNAFCFDIAAACSGFIYAMDVASQYFATGRVKNVLVIASEKLSSVTDYTDRSTCVLFGDGAAAAVLTEDETAGVLSSYLKCDGSGADTLLCKLKRVKSPWEKEIRDPHLPERESVLLMNGPAVYKFAVRAMVDACRQAIELAGVAPEEISAVVPHQANIRIINSAKAKLGIPEERFYVNMDRFGNTSSASVPLLLDELVQNGTVKSGELVLMCGFGAGLTYGAMVIRL